MNEAFFTAAELAEVKAYHAPHYAWNAVSDVFQLVLLFFTLRYLIRPLHRAAEKSAAWLDLKLSFTRTFPVMRVVPAALDRLWSPKGWGAALLFAFYDLMLNALLFLPVNIYFGYVLEHRHGLSNQTPWMYAWDYLKEMGGETAAISALAFGLYGLARRLKQWWLILGVVAGIAMFGSALLDPYRAQVYYEQTPLPAGALRDRITALMKKANVDFRDVLVEKSSVASKKIQAYFAGQGPTRTIVLSDSLLAAMNDEEVSAVIAHESGHVQEHKWPGRMLSFFAVIATLYFMHRIMLWVARRRFWGVENYGDIRTLPLVSALVFLVISYSSPVAGYFSRQRELNADLFGISLTQDPDAFASMLVKAARVNKMDPTPPWWVVWRGWSHPPMGERLEHMKSLKNAADR